MIQNGGSSNTIQIRMTLLLQSIDLGGSKRYSKLVLAGPKLSNWKALLKNKKVESFLNSFAIHLLFPREPWLNWLESRTCGINQRVVPPVRDPAGGAKVLRNQNLFLLR